MRFVGIDPSTKCGLVIIKLDGTVELATEMKSKVKEDPERFMDLADKITDCLKPGDIISIEGFSFGSQGRGVSTQYGIGWLIRAEMIRNGLTYTEVSPGGLKKFASGKGNTKKDELVLPIFKRWGFESNSDNIRDAFVLAQISKGLHDESGLVVYQKEVIKKVLEGKQ